MGSLAAALVLRGIAAHWRRRAALVSATIHPRRVAIARRRPIQMNRAHLHRDVIGVACPQERRLVDCVGPTCPMDVRLPHPPVLGCRQPGPHLVQQREPRVVGQVCEPPHGGVERDEPFAVERLRIRERRRLESPER